jgi:hypothetical protein
MKKPAERQEPACEDDAYEVKNAMLMTALLAQEQNRDSNDTGPNKKVKKQHQL